MIMGNLPLIHKVMSSFNEVPEAQRTMYMIRHKSCKLTLQVSSPWKPPATRILSLTANVLIWVCENPSNKFPAYLYKTKESIDK